MIEKALKPIIEDPTIACVSLAKKVNLLDPNHETFISEEMVLNIKEKNVINEAIYMVKTAADMYELEKGNIDNKYKRHLN